MVNWTLRNKLQWNFNQNSYIFIQENALETSSAKRRPFCLGLNVLRYWLSTDRQKATIDNLLQPILTILHAMPKVQQVKYRKLSNITRTNTQNLNVFRFGLQLSLCNILKPSVKWRMKMQLEQRRQAMLQLHLSYQQFNCLLKCPLY